MLIILELGSDKRRIAQHIAALFGREDFFPIHAQGVGLVDVGGLLEWQAAVELAEGFGEPDVHLVVHQPEGHLGDAGGPFGNLDAVELVHVHLRELVHVQRQLALGAVEDLQDFQFQQAQLAIGDDEEVAAAAGGVEEAQAGEALVEAAQLGLVLADALELGAQVVQEQGAGDLEDVALGGVVAADLAALARLHDGLEERAEDGGRDGRPVEPGAGQQRVAHVTVEVGDVQVVLAEQLAVDVGEGRQRLVQVLLPLVFRRVEHAEEVGQVQAQVGAVLGGAVFEVELEGFTLEEAGVFRKEAEEHAHEEPFELVPACSLRLQEHRAGGP